MKTFNLRKYLAEGYLFKEEDNFNNEKYPKAEAWLEEHPNVEVFDEVPEEFLQYDTEDSPEDIETAITEAGYMFISELEAALEGGMDDEYLESCAENGVINDPTYNPPVNSWNYLDEDSSLQKEAVDGLGQYHGSQAFSNREIRTADDLIQDMNRVLGPECMKACSDFQGNRIFYRLVCQPDWRQAQHLINSCKKYGAEVTEVPGDVLSPYKVRIKVQDGNICVTSKGRSSSIIYLSKGIFDKLPHGTCPKEPRTDDMGRRI